MTHFWRSHSLSIATTVLGLAIMGACIPLKEGTYFDLISGVGNSLLAIGLGGWLYGWFTEKNKPED